MLFSLLLLNFCGEFKRVPQKRGTFLLQGVYMKKQLFLCAALSLSFFACNEQGSGNENVVNLASPDTEKMAYLFGMQLSHQLFASVPYQVGEGISLDAVCQGFEDASLVKKDSTKKLQLSSAQLQNIGQVYSVKAQTRIASIQPDSAKRASMHPMQMRAYMDSSMKALPKSADPMVTGKPVKVDSTSPDIDRFSYMFGVNFSAQFENLSAQSEMALSEAAFREGLTHGYKSARDTSYKGVLPKDSVDAVGKRFQEKMQELQKKRMEAAKAEEEKLKAEIAPLRGDTLADGMPAKMNYKVKMDGITIEAEDLQSYVNKPLFIFYFSSTCGHCQHAAPEVNKLAESYKAAGLNAIAIASASNSKKGIRQFIENTKLNLPVLIDEGRQFGELYSDGYVPKIYLVSPDASYKMYKSFEKDLESIKKDISELLKK